MKTLKAIPYQQGTLFVDEQAEIKEAAENHYVTLNKENKYRFNHLNKGEIVENFIAGAKYRESESYPLNFIRYITGFSISDINERYNKWLKQEKK